MANGDPRSSKLAGDCEVSAQSSGGLLDYATPAKIRHGVAMGILPGIVALLCLPLALLLPVHKGSPEALLAYLLAAILTVVQVGVGIYIALRRPHEAGASRKWGPMWMGVACVAGCLIVWPALVAGAKAGSNLVPCASRLRQIGQGVFLYAADHNGEPPPSLEALATHTGLGADVFACPDHPSRIPRKATPAELAAAIAAGHSSYLYFGAGMRRPILDDAIIAIERLENHAGGAYVLFGDGHVEWIMLPEARWILDELRQGHNPPRPPTTAPAR